MKNIFLFLIFLPIFIFGQSERSQKQSYRGGQGGGSSPYVSPRQNSSPQYRPTQPAQYPRNNSGVDYYSENQQKQSYRQQRGYQREEDRFHGGGSRYQYHNYNYWRQDPYWNWGYNRWYGWGAPYSYHYWYPEYYYDSWGYRQPMRIYIQEDGKVDTIRGYKQNYSIGVHANKEELGGFFTVGRKTFFIAEYQHRYQRDKSTFYPDITRDVAIPWKDRRSEDIKKGGTAFLGIGKRFGRTGAFAALGLVTERIRYQYFDELYILSNNGYYSFPSYTDTYLALKLGILQDIKAGTIKVDYEPTRNLISVGVGVNF